MPVVPRPPVCRPTPSFPAAAAARMHGRSLVLTPSVHWRSAVPRGSVQLPGRRCSTGTPLPQSVSKHLICPSPVFRTLSHIRLYSYESWYSYACMPTVLLTQSSFYYYRLQTIDNCCNTHQRINTRWPGKYMRAFPNTPTLPFVRHNLCWSQKKTLGVGGLERATTKKHVCG